MYKVYKVYKVYRVSKVYRVFKVLDSNGVEIGVQLKNMILIIQFITMVLAM